MTTSSAPTTEKKTSGRLKKEPRRSRDDDNTGTRRRRRRRRRRGGLIRGGVFAAIREAALEGLAGTSRALADSVGTFVDQERDDRDKGRRRRIDRTVDNFRDARWDAYDTLIDVPRKMRDAYNDEIDAYEDEDDDEWEDDED